MIFLDILIFKNSFVSNDGKGGQGRGVEGRIGEAIMKNKGEYCQIKISLTGLDVVIPNNSISPDDLNDSIRK